MERTEEDKIVQAPVKVILGGKEYPIHPLPIKYSLPWVKKVAALIGSFLSVSQVTTDDQQGFEAAFNHVMADNPVQVVELFFEYARDLNRDEIEEVASSAELVSAFEEVVKLERPLFGMTLHLIAAATGAVEVNVNPNGASGVFSSSSSPSGMSRRKK